MLFFSGAATTSRSAAESYTLTIQKKAAFCIIKLLALRKAIIESIR